MRRAVRERFEEWEKRVRAAESAIHAICPHDVVEPTVHIMRDGSLEWASFRCASCAYVALYGYKWISGLSPINRAAPFSDMPPRYRDLLTAMGVEVPEKG